MLLQKPCVSLRCRPGGVGIIQGKGHLHAGPPRDSPTCSDLQGMVDSLGATENNILAQPPPRPYAKPATKTSNTTASTNLSTSTKSTSTKQQLAQPPLPKYDARYYSGFFTSDLQQQNNASGNDTLYRNLKLSGSLAGFLVILFFVFMFSNGLLGPPS